MGKLKEKRKVVISDLIEEIKEVMGKYVGISRNEKELKLHQEFISAVLGSDPLKLSLPKEDTFIASQKKSEKGEIVMAFLPAYSPELNPDEQVWNHAKARLAKLPVASKEVMKKSFTSILRSIQKSTSLIKSFFKMKDTLYINNTLT